MSDESEEASGSDPGEGQNQGGGPLVNIAVTGRDLLGIGKAAKTPGAKVVFEAFARLMDAVSDPLHTLLKGHAEISVETRRIVALERAYAKTDLIRDGLPVGLRERAGLRLITEETRKQANLEHSIAEAIEILEERGKARQKYHQNGWRNGPTERKPPLRSRYVLYMPEFWLIKLLVLVRG
jgi:hypothetical protein